MGAMRQSEHYVHMESGRCRVVRLLGALVAQPAVLGGPNALELL